MRKSTDDLEFEERQRRFYETQRYGYELTLNEQTANNVARAAHGSYYTNPELTASLGLSGIPVDMLEVHKNSQKQRIKWGAAPKPTAYISSPDPKPEPEDTPLPYGVTDLLRIPEQDRMRYRRQPAWWDEVDPDGLWRSIPVPTEIKDARELINLQEAQVIKLFLSKSMDEWLAIPGMVAEGTFDSKGKRIPGTFDAFNDLSAKFPQFGQMWMSRAAVASKTEPWSVESISQNVLSAFQEATQRTVTSIQTPFKIAGFFAPDHIGPAGGVEVAGVGLPSRVSLKGLGELAKGTIRTTITPFVAAAQGLKSTTEQVLVNEFEDGIDLKDFNVIYNPVAYGMALADRLKDPEAREAFKTSVIEGNVLTQIARQFVAEGRIDVGTGFFPEGQAAAKARELHDQGLPKIEGRTWTFGNALIEPLIKEGWIDRDGYAATLMSGIADAGFTLITDPAIIGDPVRAVMKAFNLGYKPATAALKGRMADLVEESWAARRQAAGLPAAPNLAGLDIIDITPQPRFAGMLPAGATLPDEAEAVARQVADDIVENSRALEQLDAPPPVLWEPDDAITRRQRMGVIAQDDGPPVLDPIAIDAMPFTTDGQITLNKLASFKNVGELYDFFLGEIPPGLAYRLQKVVDDAAKAGQEVDLTQLHVALKEGVLSGDPFYNIAQVPGVMRQWTQQTGKKLAYYTYGKTRQLANMPHGTFFSFEDPLASIRDMNRLMVVMKVPNESRHAMLSKAIEAVATGRVDRRFALADDWMNTVLRPSLEGAGVSEEWIQQLTRWSGWSDDVQQWTMDAIGQGYPLSWLADGTGQVLMSTDLIAKGFMMVNPDVLKDVVRATTNLWKIFGPVIGDKAVEKLAKNSLIRSIEKYQANYLKPIALGAPLPIRMVTRVVPDSIGRIAFSEGFDETAWKVLFAAGHVNYNTMGVELRTAKQIGKLVPIMEELDFLYKRLDNATQAGDGALVNEVTSLIDEIENQFGTFDDLQKQVDTFNERINTSLPGTSRNLVQLSQGLMADERALPAVVNYERQASRKAVYFDYTENIVTGEKNINFDSQATQNWITGTARAIVQMSDTPEYVEVAKAMLAGGPSEVLRLPSRFLDGDLKPVFDKIWARMIRNQGVKGMSETIPLTTYEGNSLWVYTIFNDIATRTAGDRVAIGAIATGKIGPTPISADDAWKIKTSRTVNVYEPNPVILDWVKEHVITSPNVTGPGIPAIPAPFAETVATGMVGDTNAVNRMLTKTFSLYRNTEMAAARSPYQRYKKWQRIRELIPVMDPEEARKMVDAIADSNAPEWLARSLRAELPRANGRVNREQAELLGEMYGHQAVDDLLYNYENASYFGYRHSLLFAFFDAWKEQWAVWGRQMATNPSSLEKTRLGLEGLKGAQIPGISGSGDGQGILFKDEESGEYAVTVWFSKQFYEMIGLNAEERIKTKNLSLLGSAVPGFFGFGAIVMDSVIPKIKGFEWLRRTTLYGDPRAKSGIGDFIAPRWLQATVAGASSAIGSQQTTDLVTNLEAILGSETNDAVLASLTNSIWKNQSDNWDGIPMNAKEREEFLEGATTKAGIAYAIVRGLAKIVLPGASSTKFFFENGEDRFTQGEMQDRMREYANKAVEEGRGYDAGLYDFLEEFGPAAWVFLAGSPRAYPGMQATNEFSDWEKKNPGLLEKYSLVAGYMGPQEGEYDDTVYAGQSSRGLRTVAELEDSQREAFKNIAWVAYNHKADTLIQKGFRDGLTEDQVRSSERFKNEMKAQSEALKNRYPMWDPEVDRTSREATWNNQREQIELMVQDDRVLKLDAGKALREYWDYRNRNLEKSIQMYPELANENWETSRLGERLRQFLNMKGEEMVKKYPDFAPLWERVLSREFKQG